MSKWIAEFELEDGDTMPEHMDLNYMGARIDFHCRPLEQEVVAENATTELVRNSEELDCISRANLKKRLQEHHDFFVNAYGGYRNLPPNDKSRVDEITHCIAEVVNISSVHPKTGHCKDCKQWKDSDGVYRRGVHAESKCPINRREVFEGNGYCFMFEQKMESEG